MRQLLLWPVAISDNLVASAQIAWRWSRTLEPEILVGRRVGVAPDQVDPGLLDSRTDAPDERELDPKKREAQLHRIQGILHDRVTHVPIYELAFIWGVSPRVEEPGINLIRSYAYSAPYEDLRLKRP